MNEVTKKKKKRRRRKAFVKRLRKMCCVPSEVDSSEDFHEEEEQANNSEDPNSDSISAFALGRQSTPTDVVHTTALSSETVAAPLCEHPVNGHRVAFSALNNETPANDICSQGPANVLCSKVQAAAVSSGGSVETQDKRAIWSCDTFGQPENASSSSSSSSSITSTRLGPGTENLGLTINKVTSDQEPRNAVYSTLEKQRLRETLSESNVTKTRDVTTRCWPALSCVRASFHQGSALHFRSLWAGNQCTTMSLAAVTMSAIKPVHKWSKSFLNSILYTGDKNHGNLLASLQRDPKELKTSDVQKRIGLFELKGSVPIKFKGDYHMMDVCPGSDSSGVVFTCPEGEKIHKELGTPLLKDALARALESPNTTGAVFTVGDFSTGLMIDPTGGYRLWDSHSRGSAGFYLENGSAVLLSFKSLEDIQTHIELQLEMRNSMFETYDVVGFHVQLGERAVKKLEKKKQKEEEKESKRLFKKQKREQK